MKTRKQKTPAKKRARPSRVGRGAAKARPAATRKARRTEVVPAVTPVESRSAEAASEDASLTLAAECTVAQADSLKAGLIRLLGDPRAVILDVSALQRIDTAGLQLLAAFVRDRRTAGHRIEWRGRAPALESAAGFLGLRSMLELAGKDGR
jgi:phospholipid transport system transporter-binding protein